VTTAVGFPPLAATLTSPLSFSFVRERCNQALPRWRQCGVGPHTSVSRLAASSVRKVPTRSGYDSFALRPLKFSVS
jgi:hypothetical protein